MKVFFLTLVLAAFVIPVTAQHYKVTLHTPNYRDGLAYLTYYYGKTLDIEDSSLITGDGVAVFEKNEKLLPGVYSIVFPGKTKLLDFLVDTGQDITISADTSDLVHKVKITGCPANDLFQQYQEYIAAKGKELQHEITAFRQSRNHADSMVHEANYNRLNKELDAYREGVIRNHPASMLAALFKSMKDPPVLYPRPKTREDSLANYQYYKAHYWDGITFMDGRIIRTPFFLPKLERYYRQVISPSPDSIIAESDNMLLRARTSPEMFKFLLNWLTDEYINPRYMGQDAVFVHLFERYHSKGLSPWLNAKQMKTISDRAYMLMSNLIGEQAADLQMIDSSGVSMPLYAVNSPFTIVCFWDPTCSHCREDLPHIDSIYRAKWIREGVKIYGVLTDNKQIDKWKEFMIKDNLKDWINVYESPAQEQIIQAAKKPSYKQLYDVIQTPTIYLLDKDKRIIAKKLTWQQIDGVLDIKVAQLKEQNLHS
ncbi:MAG: DUF5106 domain-containing protein [Bacteroidota bacterium]|nr:DUF5106 domain-containing protein [Bacteroidota bacterium]